MAAEIVVLEYKSPRVRLLSWLLRDDGMSVREVQQVGEAIDAAAGARCLIVNSDAESTDIASALRELQAHADHTPIGLVEGGTRADEVLPLADFYIEHGADAEEMLAQVRGVIGRNGRD